MAAADDINIGNRDQQHDLFGPDQAPAYQPDPDRVRARVHRILEEAREAESLISWQPGRLSLYRTIFPQLTGWLPEEEAAQLRFEFKAELERLAAA